MIIFTFYGKLLSAQVTKVLQQHVFPVAPVRYQTQVGQRFFGRTDFALDSGQQVTCAQKIKKKLYHLY